MNKSGSQSATDLLAAGINTGNTEIVEFLLKHGADINLRNTQNPPLAKPLPVAQPLPIPAPVATQTKIPETAIMGDFTAATTRTIVAPETAVFKKRTPKNGLIR